MRPAKRQKLRLSGGSELSYITAGEPSNPAIVLLHGVPTSVRMFRHVIPILSKAAYVIAPDLPGQGESDVMPNASFAASGAAVEEVLDELDIGPRYIYLNDFGAPVGLHIAMKAPEQVLGLIVQNANAHETGHGPGWEETKAYWSHPNAENEAAATAHLTFEGTRNTYVSDIPPDVAARIPAESWEEDWRLMQLPGRMDTQKALVKDYGNFIASFGAIADYLKRWQPSGLMLWGRHDPYFALDETLSWLKDLPRMEAHIFDAGHMLLETHSEDCAALMLDFIGRNSRDQSISDAA